MSLIGKPSNRHLTAAEFAKEIPLWRQSGRQDAANVMDSNELEDDLGARPTAAAIKTWLLKWADPSDPEDSLPTGTELSPAQKRQLHSAWADGWSAYAANVMASRKPSAAAASKDFAATHKNRPFRVQASYGDSLIVSRNPGDERWLVTAYDRNGQKTGYTFHASYRAACEEVALDNEVDLGKVRFL